MLNDCLDKNVVELNFSCFHYSNANCVNHVWSLLIYFGLEFFWIFVISSSLTHPHAVKLRDYLKKKIIRFKFGINVKSFIWNELRPRILLLNYFHFRIAELNQRTIKVCISQITSILNLLISKNLIIIEKYQNCCLEAVCYYLIILR